MPVIIFAVSSLVYPVLLDVACRGLPLVALLLSIQLAPHCDQMLAGEGKVRVSDRILIMYRRKMSPALISSGGGGI